MNHSRGGGVTVTGGDARESRRKPEEKSGNGLPNLKIMLVVVILVLLGPAWLAMNGY